MPRRALSATRAAAVLNYLAAHPEERLSYSELSRRLDINLSSMHSVLVALTESGYLTCDPRDKTYGLGAALVAVGDAALRQSPLVDDARGRIRALSHATGLEALVFVRAGIDLLCVARTGPPQPRGATMQVGQRVPLIAPLGSAAIAWAPEAEQEAWIERGSAPLRARRQQRALLETVRERGYSIALEVSGRRKIGEVLVELAETPESPALLREIRSHISELGHGEYQLPPGSKRTYRPSTLTAPVFDRAGDLALVMTLQGFTESMRADAIETLGETLRAACDEVGAS